MLLISYGTRPEWIKLRPLIKELDKHGDIPYKVLFTGQHKDLLPKDAKYDFKGMFGIKSLNRLDNIFVNSLSEWDRWVGDKPTSVLVQGDTTSAFAIALAAFHRKIPVIHLEAGMRTGMNHSPYPEEFNRRAISVIAETHLCASKNDMQNLVSEFITGKMFVVGNTVLDNIRDLSTSYEDNIVITFHRRENHNKTKEWFESLNDLAETYKNKYDFIFPMHPNPNIQKYKHLLNAVKVVNSMEYEGFIDLLANCSAVITDSGGVQEEACYLGKRIFSLRELDGAERFDSSTKYIADPSKLKEQFEQDLEYGWDIFQDYPCPYGDGHSSEKIYQILKKRKK